MLKATSRREDASRALVDELQKTRGKRELVKGVLRVRRKRGNAEACLRGLTPHPVLRFQGLILESGMDWYGNRKLRELMLSLGDDDLDGSDEEPDFDSDESIEDDDET